MHRLSGEDAGFLAMESAEQPMNTQAVAILRPHPSTGPITLEEVRSHVVERLDQLPSFRWRVVPVPFGLHQPVVVRDWAFDIDFHLRRATLEEGESLDQRFAAMAERRLDRRHPLWQITLLDGLADQGQALILKYHHALADGVAAATIFERVFSDGPTLAIPGEPLPWKPEPRPGSFSLVLAALWDHASNAPRLVRLGLRARRGVAAVAERRRLATVTVPAFSGAAPNSEVNQAFTTPRAYARAALALGEVKEIKDRAGTTLNDVVLAVMAGALRGYLLERNALPALPLLASVPVSYEPADAPLRQAGNRFWSFTTTLATDVSDPVERLRVISSTAAEAKAQLGLLGADLMPALLDHVPPLVAALGARALVGRLRALGPDDPVDANVLISNIKGPSERWTLLGRAVDDLYIDGPPSNGVGANVMLWSYGDRILLGILAFASALGDPPALSRWVERSHLELRDALRVPNLGRSEAVGPAEGGSVRG